MEYPLLKLSFEADWGGTQIGFTEISGLNLETAIVEYRHGASPDFNKIKMPGLKANGNITMKKGTFKTDNDAYNWFKTIQLNTVERRTITISLLDETGAPAVTWKVKNAFIAKLMSTDLKADGNEVAIETLEIAHEGLTIEHN